VSCYTVLNHTQIDEANKPENEEIDYYSYEDIHYLDDCTKCHTDYHKNSYLNPYYSEYSFYRGSSSRWLNYYTYPWWLNKTYYSQNYDDSGASLNETRRDFIIRNPAIPSQTPQNIPITRQTSSGTTSTDKSSQKTTDSSGRTVKRTETKTDKKADQNKTNTSGKKRKSKTRK